MPIVFFGMIVVLALVKYFGWIGALGIFVFLWLWLAFDKPNPGDHL